VYDRAYLFVYYFIHAVPRIHKDEIKTTV